MKNNVKGITLVSMVITIIVMLILAGVSISMVTGDNGVLTRASEGSVKTTLASVRDDLEMAISSLQTDYMNDWTNNRSIAARKAQYFIINGLDEDDTNDGVNARKGMNDYLNVSKIITATSSNDADITINAPATLYLAGIAEGNNASTKDALASLKKDSVKTDKTKCGYELSALFLSNGKDSEELGSDIYIALYYMKDGVPNIVDIGLIESTFTAKSEKLTMPSSGEFTDVKSTSITTPITGITWLENAELDNN